MRNRKGTGAEEYCGLGAGVRTIGVLIAWNGMLFFGAPAVEPCLIALGLFWVAGALCDVAEEEMKSAENKEKRRSDPS